jgi:hypothetical protein
MKKWTVILLYPDYMADDYGSETYMTCVRAADPAGAVAKARAEVCAANEVDEDDAEDFFVIAVMRGEHDDVNPER